MARQTIVAGNWKMYKTIEEAVLFLGDLEPLLNGVNAEVFIAAPFTAIEPLSRCAEDKSVTIGAQNMNDATEGAFTGEVACGMLMEAGAQFVLLGHSERRHIFGETSTFINAKVKKSLSEGLRPIVCIGEQKEAREEGRTAEVLKEQLAESLADLKAKEVGDLVIAYEPVWAIGTGLTATPEMAQETHAEIREMLVELFNKTAAKKIPILYGGSVKPANAQDLMSLEDVDGVLVGGASLEAASFAAIAQSAAPVKKTRKRKTVAEKSKDSTAVS